MAKNSYLREIFPALLIIAIDIMGVTMLAPLLPLYSVALGSTPVTYGLLAAAYPSCQFISAPILGHLSDRYGRKPLLLISQVGTLIGFLLLASANSLVLLFVSRIIDGISGGNISIAQAIVTDKSPEDRRTQGLGLVGAALGSGFILGPLLTSVALQLSNQTYAVPAYLAAGFSLTSILLTVFTLSETHAAPVASTEPTGSRFSLPKERIVILLLATMLIQQIAMGGMEALLPLFTLVRLGMNARDNILPFLIGGIALFAVEGYFIGRWSKRFSEVRLVRVGLLLLACGLFLFAMTPSLPVPWYSSEQVLGELQHNQSGTIPSMLHITLPAEVNLGWGGLLWILLSIILCGIGAGMLHPTLNSLMTRQVPANESGRVLGFSSSVYSAGNALAPIIAGSLFSINSRLPFVTGTIILLLLLVVSVQFRIGQRVGKETMDQQLVVE